MALRQTLIPFFYDLLHRYHADCTPMVRPTWLDFPEDAAAWEENDEHLLGPDLLVAPVMEQGAEVRAVCPPAGAEWIEVWTGRRIEGGTEALLSAPLEGPPPLLARAGSGMLVDLAKGGWKPEPYRRGLWLFPPRNGAFASSAVEDAGDGDGPIDRWSLTGMADADRIVVEIGRDGPGSFGDNAITILLPQGETRVLVVNGDAGTAVTHDGRSGVEIRV
jgi:alpha-glucosidase